MKSAMQNPKAMLNQIRIMATKLDCSPIEMRMRWKNVALTPSVWIRMFMATFNFPMPNMLIGYGKYDNIAFYVPLGIILIFRKKHQVQIKIKKFDEHNLSIQFTSETKEKNSKAISDFQSLYQDVMDRIKQEDIECKDHAVEHIKHAMDVVKFGNKHVYIFETCRQVSMLSEDKEALKHAKYTFEQCLSLNMTTAKPCSSPARDNFTEVYKFVTKDGINVSVARGNIALQDVDAIVNAANKYIQNGSGVTGAIFKQGGWKFEQLCKEAMEHRQNQPLKVGEVVTVKAAGSLQCKRVLHLVEPQWKKYSHKEEAYHLLEDGLLSVLKESNHYGASTLALPPVATGIYGTPLELFVRAMNTALTCFETNISRNKRSLHYIRILSIDQDTVNDLKTMFSSGQPHVACHVD
ncbi:uncharacterized protein LOC144746195 [Ciona intestinalis]